MSLFIGELKIDRIEEFCGAVVSPDAFLVGLPEDAIERNADWLIPYNYDPVTSKLVTSVHSWVVRTRHHTVLIDSCFGNGKNRPAAPPGHKLDLPWLDRLARVAQPEEIDFVMCTHMHADHVGWNTQLQDGRWVPTFPNARYLFSQREYDHWSPDGEHVQRPGHEDVFSDSVLPCVEAGQVDLVNDGYVLDNELMVEAASGHTVGNIVVRAKSAGRTGLFTGDCLHTPLQVVYPEVNTVACELPEQARETRLRILSDAAEHGHLLLPAHFPPPFAGRIKEVGGRFRYQPGA